MESTAPFQSKWEPIRFIMGFFKLSIFQFCCFINYSMRVIINCNSKFERYIFPLGFGDQPPSTIPGQAAIILCALFGIPLCLYIVALLSSGATYTVLKLEGYLPLPFKKWYNHVIECIFASFVSILILLITSAIFIQLEHRPFTALSTIGKLSSILKPCVLSSAIEVK